MQASREIHHILFGALACLLFIALSAAYWAIGGRDALLLRDDNPRLIEALAAVQRGSIVDRNAQLLAETTGLNAALTRHYHRPSAFSVAGYYSLRYGVSGAEAAFDMLLSGSSDTRTLHEFFERHLLRLPQTGADVRLTIDADLQDALVAALGESRGAAVVLDAQTGEILALVSQPSYDPNTLDDDWADLVEADGQPFFNRALQGQYQLGGAMYSVLLAEAIDSGVDLSQPFADADAPIVFADGMTLACVITPERSELTLVDAFAYGCPSPFQAYLLADGPINIDTLLLPYKLDEQMTLAGFPQPEPIDLPPTGSAAQLDAATLELRAALGQGDATATPLHIAAIMGAIAADGVVMTPYIHIATRLPKTDVWLATSRDSAAAPLMSAEAAAELRRIMRRAWSAVAGESSSIGEAGAQIALSQSGEGVQTWLIGFAPQNDGAVAAFVILLEDNDDAPRMISIGQSLMRALGELTQR